MSHREQYAGLTLQKYGRFWAVYEQHVLVVVTVYKKGCPGGDKTPGIATIPHDERGETSWSSPSMIKSRPLPMRS